MSLGNWIRDVRKRQGLTQTDLGDRLGRTKANVSAWEQNSHEPSYSQVLTIAEIADWKLPPPGLPLNQLAAPPIVVPGEAANDEEHAPIRLVDAKASAGRGEIIMSQDTSKVLMFRRDWLRKNSAKPDHTIAFEVRGDSMIDVHIVDKAVVLANRDKTELRAGRVYVMWIGDDLFVKELALVDGAWVARSRNAAKTAKYKDIPIDAQSGIVGRAFWCGFGV